MSFSFSPRLQDAKTESMQTQYEYLKLLRLRHLQWMNNPSDDPELDRLHAEIAELIEQIIDRYSRLLKARRQ